MMPRLREILEEEQEPFDLEAYLLERGSSRTPNPKTTLCPNDVVATTKAVCRKIISSVQDLVTLTLDRGLHLDNDGQVEGPERLSEIRTSNQDASSFNDIQTQTHPTDQSNKVATPNQKTSLCPDNGTAATTKVLCQKDVSVRDFITVALGRGRYLSNDGSTEEPERLSDTTTSNQDASSSSSMDGIQTQTHPTYKSNKPTTDKGIGWTVKDENKSSPDSVLDETTTHEGSNLFPGSLVDSIFKKPTEDDILSASFWELTMRTENQGISSSSYISSKKALQQTRQLLFDCVKEAVESQTAHLMEPESLGKFICDSTIRQSATVNKSGRLLKSDILNIFSQWDYLQNHTQDVIQQVGDQILEEIKDELVEEVIGFHTNT